MSLFRPFRWTAVAAALTGAVSALAAGPRPAAIHPLEANGVTQEEVEDVEAVLQSALFRAARRGTFEPAPAIPQQRRCAAAGIAARTCLAKLAGQGVVLHGSVKRSGRYLIALLYATDATGHTAGPYGVALDPLIQNPDAFLSSLERLESALDAPPQQQVAAAPSTPGPSHAEAGAQMAPELRPTPPSAPAAPAMAPRADLRTEPDGAWRGTAAKWLVASGAVLIAGGATLGWLDHNLSRELEQKYRNNQLTAADGPSYSRVRTYNLASTSLLAAGAATALGGLVLWGLAPSAEPAQKVPRLWISGRF